MALRKQFMPVHKTLLAAERGLQSIKLGEKENAYFWFFLAAFIVNYSLLMLSYFPNAIVAVVIVAGTIYGIVKMFGRLFPKVDQSNPFFVGVIIGGFALSIFGYFSTVFPGMSSLRS